MPLFCGAHYVSGHSSQSASMSVAQSCSFLWMLLALNLAMSSRWLLPRFVHAMHRPNAVSRRANSNCMNPKMVAASFSTRRLPPECRPLFIRFCSVCLTRGWGPASSVEYLVRLQKQRL